MDCPLNVILLTNRHSVFNVMKIHKKLRKISDSTVFAFRLQQLLRHTVAAALPAVATVAKKGDRDVKENDW